MENSQKKIYVYDDFSFDKAELLGTLFVERIRGEEIFSFEYCDEWLIKTKASICIDPELPILKGRQYSNSQSIFKVFSDASPDRWGRVLLNRREKIISAKERRKPRKLLDSDYLLGVCDLTRMGGLRFKADLDGDFLSNDKKMAIPPWTSLRTLEEASRNLEKEENSISEKWIRQLINPGSSLGGARPKATVQNLDGNLWIAKFPSKNDDNDVGAWEMVAHDLAKLCGLNVPEAKLERFSKLGSTFLVKRFDRDGKKRIHFSSAMTLLNKNDGASFKDGTSYLDIVSFIKANGSNVKNDLKELYKRIVFNMAITNSDDHLRNHAFIVDGNGWKLSPLYDVNPTPYGDELSLNINETNNSIDIELAIDASIYFEINKEEASKLASDILEIVRNNWLLLARKYKITNKQIEDMRPAFYLADTY